MVSLTNQKNMMKYKIKNSIKYIYSKLIKIFSFLFSFKGINNKIFLKEICSNIEKRDAYFYSYRIRPKNSKEVVTIDTLSENSKMFAIVMQGPLVIKENFTLETVRIYQKLYPNVLVIISTWDTENIEYIEKLKKEKNCNVILNKTPEYSGLLNLNYQIISTLAGIKEAKRLDKKYIFKTRCDFRFYKKGMLDYLYDLLQIFPCNNNVLSQNKRIIFGDGRKGSMFRPFWFTDQFSFGDVDDIEQLWSVECQKYDRNRSDVTKEYKDKQLTWKQCIEQGYTAEGTVVLDYIKRKTNNTPECTVKNTWEYLKNYFIVVSRAELESYWYKYEDRFEDNEAYGQFYKNDPTNKCYTYNWNFATWLSLYSGRLEYMPEFESFAQKYLWD